MTPPLSLYSSSEQPFSERETDRAEGKHLAAVPELLLVGFRGRLGHLLVVSLSSMSISVPVRVKKL